MLSSEVILAVEHWRCYYLNITPKQSTIISRHMKTETARGHDHFKHKYRLFLFSNPEPFTFKIYSFCLGFLSTSVKKRTI